MTDKDGKPLSWLEWRAQRTGKTVEQIRQEMSELGKKSPRTGGFDGNPDRARELQKLSQAAKKRKKDVVE